MHRHFKGNLADTFYFHSLQLNIGIIAACATSLKPLFARILKLSTTEHYYNNSPAARYGYGSRSRGSKLTGARGGGTNNGHGMGRSRNHNNDAYELESAMRLSDDATDFAAAGGKGETYSTATSSFYKHGSPNGSGSEEMILGPGIGTGLGGPGVGGVVTTTATTGGNQNRHRDSSPVQMPPHAMTTDGIVRTTEVRVNYC
jgi:hypothetical protein